MAFKSLDTEWEQVIFIDLLSPNEREAHKISEDCVSFLAQNGVNQQKLSCATKKGVMDALAYTLNQATKINFMVQFTAHGS